MHPLPSQEGPGRYDPPRIARWLGRIFLRGPEQEFLLGDLEEEFRTEMLPKFGLRAAQRWYWGQVLKSLSPIKVRPRWRNRTNEREPGVMEGLGQDIQYGVRMLWKGRGITLIAILSLAIGIGANATVFSLVNALLFARPHLPDEDRLVWIFSPMPEERYALSSYPDYVDLRDQNIFFTDLIAQGVVSLSLQREDYNRRIWGLAVSPEYFSTLGVGMPFGRGFSHPEQSAAGPLEIILSYSFWNRHFGRDPAVLGRTLRLNGQELTIVGISPEDFRGPAGVFAPDVWVPLTLLRQLGHGTNLSDRGATWLQLMGRLKPGARLAEAEAQLQTVALQLAASFPATNQGRNVHLARVGDGHPEGREALGKASFFLMAVVCIVLVIGCANVAGLMLTQATRRQKEFGIRMALGASRSRLMRLILVEGCLLAFLAGGIGLACSAWAASLFAAFKPPAPVPQELNIALDGHVLVFTFLIALIAGTGLGILPALHLTRIERLSALKDDPSSLTPGPAKSRMRNRFVVVQIAVCTPLLIAAGLLLRSWWNTQMADPGFETQNVIVLSLDATQLEREGVPKELRLRRLLDHFSPLPGVEAVAVASRLPLGIGYQETNVSLVQGTDGGELAPTPVGVAFVEGEYFKALRIPMANGRAFGTQDGSRIGPIAVVNETLARRLWPRADPIGKPIRLRDQDKVAEVVGVARNTKYRTVDELPRPFIYLPFGQSGMPSNMAVILGTARDPRGLMPAVNKAILSFDPDLTVSRMQTMSQHLELAYWGPRVAATFFGVFALFALFLATLGLFGVISYSVAQRTREFGIRMALGAERLDLLGLVLRQGMALVAAGLAMGMVLAFMVMPLMRRALYAVSPVDVLTYLAVSTVFIGVAIIASYVPARRAARVDPLTALRYE